MVLDFSQSIWHLLWLNKHRDDVVKAGVPLHVFHCALTSGKSVDDDVLFLIFRLERGALHQHLYKHTDTQESPQ